MCQLTQGQRGFLRYVDRRPGALVMELGGQPLRGPPTPDQKDDMRHALRYLHSKGLVHLGVKAQNFVFGCGVNVDPIHLIYFGSTVRVGSWLEQFVGSPYYCARAAHSFPFEQLQRWTSRASSLWLGFVLPLLLPPAAAVVGVGVGVGVVVVVVGCGLLAVGRWLLAYGCWYLFVLVCFGLFCFGLFWFVVVIVVVVVVLVVVLVIVCRLSVVGRWLLVLGYCLFHVG